MNFDCMYKKKFMNVKIETLLNCYIDHGALLTGIHIYVTLTYQTSHS